MKLIGPDAVPPVVLTIAPLPLILENENPVPPPLFCTRAVSLIVSKISSMLSPTGSTKHAESCPSALPAFISVGEFGRNSPLVITP